MAKNLELRQAGRIKAEEADRICKAAESAGRSLTASEVARVDALTRESRESFDQAKQIEDETNKRLAAMDARDRRSGGPIVAGRREDRTGAAMFGRAAVDRGGFRDFDEFCDVLVSRQYDPRLAETRSMTEGSSDAGYLVPTEFSLALLDGALASEIVRPRATVVPMQTNEITLPAFLCDHNTTGVHGGIITYWKGEAAALSESEPEIRQLKLEAQKLTTLVQVSNELLSDWGGARAQIEQAIVSALAWELDEAAINGNGVGRPLGIIASPARYTCTAEEGQSEGIVAENVFAMWSRLSPMSAASDGLVWLAHPTVLPWLYSMAVHTGTGGVPVFTPGNMGLSAAPFDRLFGRPLIVTPHCSTVDTEGDLVLVDLARYVIGLRADVRMDISAHAGFTSDVSYLRAIVRLDGMPLDSTKTTMPGGWECSSIVALATRS